MPHITVCLVVVLSFVAGRAGVADEPAALPPHRVAEGIAYTNEHRTVPRPLRIHALRVDLADPRHEAVVVVNPDPDGGGPAEASLGSPEKMAADAGLVAAVNAAIFGALPDAQAARKTRWAVGMPVDILGWSLADGRERSPAAGPYPSLWIGDGDGATRRAGIGSAPKSESNPPRHAAAGFGVILRDGAIVVGQGGAVHPRTAAGLDAAGTTLVLLVVDGRQLGVSEGLNEHELAELMQELGCHDALNLDGGGSSVMLVGDLRGEQADSERRPGVVNSPSDGAPRPLPAMLGIRRRDR